MKIQTSFSYTADINEEIKINFTSFYNGDKWNSTPSGQLVCQSNGTTVMIPLTRNNLYDLRDISTKLIEMCDAVPNVDNMNYVDL